MQKFFDCGIDLGTTNSCLAIPDNDHGFEIIENQEIELSFNIEKVKCLRIFHSFLLALCYNLVKYMLFISS